MTDKMCKVCGDIRLSVANTTGVCDACTDYPLPAPIGYLPPPTVGKLRRARQDEQGRRLCRCGGVVETASSSYCVRCNSRRNKLYRMRRAEGVRA